MPNATISKDILLAALTGLQLNKERIDSQIAEVQAMLNGGSREVTSPTTVSSVGDEKPKTGTRKRSAAVRKRMAEAQKARWAKINGTSEQPEPTTSEPAPGKRKKFSLATRKRMAEGQRLRYLKLTGETGPESAAPEPTIAKRKLSASARKAIGDATRKRWALKRPAEASSKKPFKKTTAKKVPARAVA